MKSCRLLVSSVPEHLLEVPPLVLKHNGRDARRGSRPFGVAGHVKVTVFGVRLHCRRDRALGDDTHIVDRQRYEVGSGSKRRVGSSGDADPFKVFVVKDKSPILKGVVLS